jgi:hypothetical protein
VLGIAIAILFVTGLLSHYQYEPWRWLSVPVKPVWGYRLTQGIRVATGTATIPLLLFKLWSVYPNQFRFPPVRSIRHGIARVTVAILVVTALVQVTTGSLDVLNCYPFPGFPARASFLGYVLVGSVLVHSGSNCRISRMGSRPKFPRRTCSPRSRGTRTEPRTVMPVRSQIISRRGMLAAAGAGIGRAALSLLEIGLRCGRGFGPAPRR